MRPEELDQYEEQNNDQRGEDADFISMPENTTQSQILHELIHPHFEEQNDFINKELKISNLDKTSLSLIIEMTDLALQCKDMGAKYFSKHLILVRDSLLCGSSSLQGFERKMQVTAINVHKLPAEQRDKFNLFGRKQQ